ncbi:MAG: hypothetical protein H6702_11700 [Myxococcales bacterium]|nr:hypothetical protein [Myxococcales bacterium]
MNHPLVHSPQQQLAQFAYDAAVHQTERGIVHVAARYGHTCGRQVAIAGAQAGARAAAGSVLRRSWPGAVAGLAVDGVVGGVRCARGQQTGQEYGRAMGVSAATTGGGLAGAAAGAALGSVVPVLGTAAGAFIGGLLGGEAIARLFR